MNGIFGDMFDLNRDGELDSFERAMDFHFFIETSKSLDSFHDIDDDDNDLDDFNVDDDMEEGDFDFDADDFGDFD
jgi:hypothetical protein